MALNNFIPTFWSGLLLKHLQHAHVFGGGVINRDYEGEIKAAGDTVKINSIGDPTIGNYTKGTDIAAAEDLDDASQMLRVDQQKYYHFYIDDIDKKQTKPKTADEAMSRAAYKLNDTVDTYLAGLYTEIATGNFIGSDGSPKTVNNTAGNTPYEYLVQLGVKLDEADVPSEGRWAIIPPWMYGVLLLDDRFVGAGTNLTDKTVRNGKVGEAAGFTIHKSNNIVNISSAKYKVMAGHPMGWSYAEQLMDTEAYRPPLRFGDAMKGLMVYGAKVTRPTCLACLVASPS